MGSSQGFTRQLLNRKNYNDTAYDSLNQVPVVTIDRQETLLPKCPRYYVITMPNNIAQAKPKLEGYFRKIEEQEHALKVKTAQGATIGKNPNAVIDEQYKIVLIPVEDFHSYSQKSFKEIKAELVSVVPKNTGHECLTLMKTQLKDSGTPIIRFIGFKLDKSFRKSMNLFLAQSAEVEDSRSKMPIYRTDIQQLD